MQRPCARSAVDHHKKAHAALARAHDYLDLRERLIDPVSTFHTPHHLWIERYCFFMASVALHVVVKNHAQLKMLRGS